MFRSTATRCALQRRIVLAKKALGNPTVENFRVEEGPRPQPAEGECLVRNLFVSADPGQKGYISAAKNYLSVDEGDVMKGFGVGVVEESKIARVPVGSYVCGFTGWQEYGIGSESQLLWQVVDPQTAPLSAHLGVLGLTGLTAHIALTKLCQPAPGHTVLVSTAAGSVGSVVGQLAAAQGCRVVGITGGPDKVRRCTEEYGYDAAIDYQAGPRDGPGHTAYMLDQIRSLCPDGVNSFYDMTGGSILDAAVQCMVTGGRVAVVGTAATANWNPPPPGPRIERAVLIGRLSVTGFICYDWASDFGASRAELARLLREGKLKYREHVYEGLEQAPAALRDLYTGANTGKAIIRVASA
eukprot:TRINITY_DN13121_c0_g1_i4.p1 TRINITY_DN13121_c0_g1~~TRINITY_DN13121_c0_g1_i4.p1  ORF type:complete len:354 (+),score=43.65 TRINITY_DN13121_c0_g1_i4:65-1126(+)